ncbi:MAG TPA: GNAT family N-acetyltransferase [Chloroflexota bacterium]|nr:GNAT family N-acetyltransferase [Chloroflexota bacterium]
MTERYPLVRGIRLDDDLPRLVRLLREIEAADQSGEEIGEEALHGFLETPGRALGWDDWVVEDPAEPDRLIAYTILIPATAGSEADAMGAVHPAWRRGGIGADLMRRLLERARLLGVTELGVYVEERDIAARDFVLRHDFLAVAAFVAMRAEMDVPVPELPPPPGFQVRSFAALADPEILRQAMNRSFEGLWGHHQITREVLDAFLPSLLPDGTFLALDAAGQVAGMCRVEVRSDSGGGVAGYIDSPGLVRGHRQNHSLRIGLLRTAMRWLQAHGHDVMHLESWGDEPETIQLYRSQGFRDLRRALAYRREIEAWPRGAGSDSSQA